MKSSPVYQAAPVGLCYLDRELRYVEINEWFARINGVAVEEHLGLTVYDVIPDAAETLASQLEVVAESREPMLAGRVATRTRAHPNEKRTYEHNFFPDIRRGAVVGFNIVVWDVTDRVDGRGQETGSTVHNALEAPAAPPPDTKAAGARPNTPTIELPFDAVLTAREREVVVALARTGGARRRGRSAVRLRTHGPQSPAVRVQEVGCSVADGAVERNASRVGAPVALRAWLKRVIVFDGLPVRRAASCNPVARGPVPWVFHRSSTLGQCSTKRSPSGVTSPTASGTKSRRIVRPSPGPCPLDRALSMSRRAGIRAQRTSTSPSPSYRSSPLEKTRSPSNR